MKSLIRKILKEETNNKFIDKVAKNIKPPYFKNMVDIYGASESEFVPIMKKVFNQYVEWEDDTKSHMGGWSEPTMNILRDKTGYTIYKEDINGDWEKSEYNECGRETYHEDSTGYWTKAEYDEKCNETYFENSKGYTYGNRR